MSENLVRYMPLFTAEEKELLIHIVNNSQNRVISLGILPFLSRITALSSTEDAFSRSSQFSVGYGTHTQIARVRNKLLHPEHFTPFWVCSELFLNGPDNE